MHTLVKKLSEDYPHLTFTPGKSFYWCPETAEVFYDPTKADQPASIWSLLHETSHAMLGHTTYKADLELLQLEVAAWHHAISLAQTYGAAIEDEYVQDCLDTYRDWLYKRSVCPGCGTQCLQTDEPSHYRCYNCHSRWHVSPSRFCRAYRRSQHKKSSLVFALTTQKN